MNDTDNKLNRVLHVWRDRQIPSAEDRAELTQTVRRAVRTARPAAHPVSVSDGAVPFAGVFGRLAYVALGLAAALLAMFILNIREEGEGTSSEHPRTFADSAQSLAAIDDGLLAEAALLFREMNATLADRLKWMAETDDDVQVATIDREVYRPLSAEPLVLVRTLVLSRPISGGKWRSDWRAQVVTRAQETVRVNLGDDAAALTIWTFPLDGEAVAVDSRLQVKGDLDIETSASEILISARPVGIHRFVRDDREYRIMQAATVLAGQMEAAI